MQPRTQRFTHAGHTLVFDEYGSGERPVILLPGMLFSRRMQDPLARTIAERGYRVLTLDPLGHGDSDRPEEMWEYSMTIFGQQALGLMDHLELERAVVGGTSLGANATLEAAAASPERMQGMLIEMPVLDNALLGTAVAFTPLLVSLTAGAPIARAVAAVAGRIPRLGPPLTQLGLDWISQDPKPSASVLQGLFFGRVAPPTDVRRTLAAPALVIGHPRDPVHPFSDSDMLIRELRDARLVEASSILELRTRPERLTGEIVRFIDECWGGRPARKRRRASNGASAANGSAGAARRRAR